MPLRLLLLLPLLAACTTQPPAVPRAVVVVDEPMDARIVPLTLEQDRMLAE